MKKTIFYAAAAVLLLTACTNDETNAQLENSDIISLSASVSGNNTRASSQDALQDLQFASGKEIFVEVYKTGDAKYTEGNYTTGDGGTMTGTLRYPNTGENIDVKAYYPATVNSATTSFGPIATNQTEEANYQAWDLMSSSNVTNHAKADGTANLTFSHQMAKIIVNLTAGTGVSDLNLVSAVTINNTYTTATIANGVVSATSGDKQDISILGTKASNIGIIVPQTVAAGTTFITITYNGNALTYRIPAGGKTFAAGNSYTYNFTVKASSIALQSSSITAWTNENIAGGDLVI